MSGDAKWTPTGSQTVGPYFRIGLQYLSDQALVLSPGSDQTVEIRGSVLDRDGLPVSDAMLEFWSYRDAGGALVCKTAENIPYGFRRVSTDENGAFAVVIARPDAEPLAATQHFMVLVFARGLLRHLITRVYLGDAAENDKDDVLQRVPVERRNTLIARVDEKQAGLYWWDVVLQGTNETVFFAF